MFDGPQVEIKVKPHENSKDFTLFLLTSKNTKDCIKTLSKEAKSKEAVTKITKESKVEK